MTSERLFNSFIPPKKTKKQTNFWLRPCPSRGDVWGPPSLKNTEKGVLDGFFLT